MLVVQLVANAAAAIRDESMAAGWRRRWCMAAGLGEVRCGHWHSDAPDRQGRRALRQPIERSQVVGGDAQAGIHSEVSSSTRRSSLLRP
jgi:hypothetical protein